VIVHVSAGALIETVPRVTLESLLLDNASCTVVALVSFPQL
jgi:hypothetical protein